LTQYGHDAYTVGMATKTAAAAHLVKQARRDRGWTHNDMARAIIEDKRLGTRYAISEATIRRVEQKRTKMPYTRAAFAIATILELRVSDLWPTA
jgi:DNA-binding XRE family transcriptional regulator